MPPLLPESPPTSIQSQHCSAELRITLPMVISLAKDHQVSIPGLVGPSVVAEEVLVDLHDLDTASDLRNVQNRPHERVPGTDSRDAGVARQRSARKARCWREAKSSSSLARCSAAEPIRDSIAPIAARSSRCSPGPTVGMRSDPMSFWLILA